MNQGQPIRRLGLPLFFLSALIACVTSISGLAGAAEDQVSPDAVAGGLQKIEDIAASSAEVVGENNAKAEELHADIEPVWEKIEGTVRANDSSAYVALEDSFTLLKIAAKSADPAKASTASEGLSSAVKSYLAAPSTASAAPVEGATADNGVGSGTLARTGASGALSALAGMALGFGGLAVIGGARRRASR